MYSTTIYLYQQIIRVLLIDTSGGYFHSEVRPSVRKNFNCQQRCGQRAVV
jgi:hypothetical protein